MPPFGFGSWLTKLGKVKVIALVESLRLRWLTLILPLKIVSKKSRNTLNVVCGWLDVRLSLVLWNGWLGSFLEHWLDKKYSG